MPLFSTQYYHFEGESFTLNGYKDETGDRTCFVAQTKHGGTEKVCMMNAAEAKRTAVAKARVKIKHAHRQAGVTKHV